MSTEYNDILTTINEKIEWHQQEVEKLTAAKAMLSEGQPEPASKPASKTTAKRTPKKSAKNNGKTSTGEVKTAIIELLQDDWPVMDIARELGSHPNYVRTVKKAWEQDSYTPTGRLARVKK